MSWLTKTLTSSIGKKVLMALTGLFLCTFLVVHLSGNLQLFKCDGGYAFNTYAVFMTTFPPIKVISYGNYFFILFHAFWGLYITYNNRKARPVGYAVTKNQSSPFSRNMAIFGTILLVYIVVHMSDFWYKFHYENLPYVQYTEEISTGKVDAMEMPADYTQDVKKVEKLDPVAGTNTVIVKDLYKVVSFSFQNLGLVIFYILAMVALSFHLVHGFQSAFQSLGWRHAKYTPLIKGISVWVFGILIPLGYAAMPIYFYFFK
ncbi:succinate dehydrogenase cytochrome b subunit [Leadbetterella byssophila]|uniref:Succinate dehydrogenase (Or fumarate reductase) cytochrome b subunit, b558 family n=1 Tax=Leadbetterella byssophila (strain DSM 17132 / JCM 16389 / KACC 11308 / NBRC 106382 / 4M15) TaxID=649349 RepID=E4RT37_LEAB4|nr:succinate dehydrogenase cytochrome b subunit [Leadbetterella byssophila]ADQ17745.1 succinate dehydrogenase (or fumarate reductase) cytochrome b subunit, b558 family [Leadbetterella byssophila DSM 17132]